MSDELVVCVQDTYPGQDAPLPIHKGMVYTLTGLCHYHTGKFGGRRFYHLAEVGPAGLGRCGCYWAGFFRPIRRPDISALRELARETTLRCEESPIWLDWARKAGV